MNKKGLWILIILCLLICGCNEKKPIVKDEFMPGVDVPISDLNSKFELLLFPDTTQIQKNGEVITFQMRNKSKDTIIFDQNYGMNIYFRQNSTWKPINNAIDNPVDEPILFPYSVYPPGLVFMLSPEVSEIKENTIIRIVTIGHIKEKPAEKVGAYFDIRFVPSSSNVGWWFFGRFL